jgi:alkaline phosphatase
VKGEKKLLTWLRRRRVRIGIVIVLLLAAGWLVVGPLGFFVKVERSGGWTGRTRPIDFARESETGRLIANDLPAGSRPRNLILLLGDGMGLSHIVASRCQLSGINRLLSFERMPVTGWLMTHSIDSIKTDSAANATALATGFKTTPGRLAVDPESRPLRTLFEAAREAGLATGLVTDTYFFDATPAAFVAHSVDRRDYPDVIRNMIASRTQVIVGETREDFPAEDGEQQFLFEELRRGGYRVATSWNELQSFELEVERVAAVFEPETIADEEVEPRLVQLFDFTLPRLAADPDGFVLLVETEEPDTGSHHGDFPRVLRGIRSLDEVTSRALEYARRSGETLIVITADHETGGLTLISGSPDEPLGIRWSSTSHTGAPVPFYAYGPGAEELSTLRDNTELAPRLARLVGLAW